MSGCHSFLVHTTAKSFNVITDVSDHTVPLIAFRCLLALVGGSTVSTSSRCSVAVGGGIGSRAGCTPVAAKAVCDDAPAVLHANGLEEIFKVLAVLLWDEGTQACRGPEKALRTSVLIDSV